VQTSTKKAEVTGHVEVSCDMFIIITVTSTHMQLGLIILSISFNIPILTFFHISTHAICTQLWHTRRRRGFEVEGAQSPAP